MANDVAAYRSFFAQLIVGTVSPSCAPLVRAFSAVPRERFVGPAPWKIAIRDGYIETPSDDPRFLYQNVLVALSVERGINNGQPAMHANAFSVLKPTTGERVAHIGAGTGYYTAVLAELVGPSGAVYAYEIERDLADSASENLSDRTNVRVQCVSGSETNLPQVDVIYVNAGATEPLAAWLDALTPSGRLMLPLTADDGDGGLLLLTKKSDEVYAANFVGRIKFIPCMGARQTSGSQALAEAFRGREIRDVQSFHRRTMPDGSAWCVGTDWWLSSAPP